MIPEFTRDATIRDLLDPAMDIARRGDRREAAEFFRRYTAFLIDEFGKTEEEAQRDVLTNLGYYAGYYERETQRAVLEMFGAAHPIFGGVTFVEPAQAERNGGGRR